MNIFINGVSSKFGGGKSILSNFLNQISINQRQVDIIYYCLINDQVSFDRNFNNVIFIKKRKYLHVLFYYFYYINLLQKKYKVDLILNLGDIPIICKCKQIFLFDWAFAVYPNDTIIWKRMNFKDYITRKMKIFVFNILKFNIDEYLVQTNLICEKLHSLYSIDKNKITYFPNAISFDHFNNNINDNFSFKDKFPNKKIFLCLSAYYSHKNIEILIEVAKIIKLNKINFIIILTLPSNNNTLNLFNKILKFQLHDILINIGEVKTIDIPNLYKNVHALLLPTLLESFSGTYIEAMHANVPIFTSNYDFSKEICSDSAIYFDPLNELDIYNKLLLLYDSNLISKKTIQYSNILNNLYDWTDLYEIFKKKIQKI
jgi:glycosyltransferase involved in cell wall biosynthesis